MDYSVVALYMMAVVACTASPGPMIAVLLSRSISPAWKSAMALAFGFCISRLILVVVLALGTGVWLAKSPDLLFIGKALGACYLAWLAVGMWTGSANTATLDQKQNHRLASVSAGIAIGLGNPATFLIYMILLQIVAPKGFTGLGHIGFACLITFVSVATVHLGTVFIARRLRTIVASPSSSLFLGRIAATALALTSMWIVTA
jgi:threonine/homoserine/homoserine lactone efflux protein